MNDRGPEAVGPIIDAFFRRCSSLVIGEDGIVDHFLGDSVMAFFNVPVQHEDHRERAIKVATQIQQIVPEINSTFGEEDLLKVGIGICSGLSATGTVGSEDCSDYTAMGDAVNIAARLQAEAGPGEILIESGAYDRAKNDFPHAPKRVLELKGIRDPVVAHSLS